ncbi:DUF1028 domain-containing protein [Maritimibacter sp. DP1N21-5]|uniref:DUF1028 domain-containing protein n=1 Tax=Maritimibacter sp. DP1N21-5 TaxID=2836867 RepID=UPI001C46AB2C|nr:DUF1028 domain-containing protein [Maritimibacter sp. DP1N21-5]MBV7409312.1 DUF1028 domain-containing protein [Maritimibacter sp. DP1N21-5]
MTYSILARDPETGAFGGAAATGSLCVGGWVLRGRAGVGMSASQGASPSTLWGDEALAALETGETAAQAVSRITGADGGRDFRQLAVIGTQDAASFTGASNTPKVGEMVFETGVATGNLLASDDVVPSTVEAFRSSAGHLSERLLAALVAGRGAGSDSRGLMSAALLVVSPHHAPLSLRIDYAPDPVGALLDLHDRATSGDYAFWARQVPTLAEPERALD